MKSLIQDIIIHTEHVSSSNIIHTSAVGLAVVGGFVGCMEHSKDGTDQIRIALDDEVL